MAVVARRPVLDFWRGDDIVPSQRILTVYEDGSVLTPWAAEFGGPGVRRLSADGLAHLLSKLRSTRAFDRPRSFPPPADWAAGFSTYDIDLSTGGTAVRVSATNASRDPMGKAVVALGDRLENLPAMLPAASDWADGSSALHPYLPAGVRVTVQAVALPVTLVDLPVDRLDAIAGFLPGPVESFGVEVTNPEGPISARCAVVDGAAGIALQEAAVRRFDTLDTGTLIDGLPGAFPTLGGVDVGSADGRALVRVAWHAAWPDESGLACDGTGLPHMPDPARYAARGADLVLGSDGGIGGDGPRPIRLEVRVTRLTGGVSGTADVFYLEDGTIVVMGPPAPLAGYGVRRLSDAGLRLLDDRLAGAALPATERHATTTDGSSLMYTLIFGENLVVEAADVERQPEARRIIDLATRLADPSGTFPAAAWRDPRLMAYHPDSVAVRVRFVEAVVPPRAELSMVAPAFAADTFGKPGTAAPDVRCDVLPTDVARALARSFRAVTAPAGDAFGFATGTPGQRVEISFEMRGPMDTPPQCD
jgi:hypothetical protein